MAAQLIPKVSVLVVISCFMLMNSACCNATRAFKVDTDADADADAVTSDWTPAVATWYGEAEGFGSDDGACGYGADVGDFPFSAMVSAGSLSLFLSGKGCGNCYQVRCTTNNACSESPVSVVITDSSCTDETCASNATDHHFDLSGTAFEALANSGQKDELLKAGSIQIEYQKVECSYPGTPLTFKIGSNSNSSNFSVLIEYVPGDGDLAQVDLQQTSVSDSWLPMQRSTGAIWVLSSGSALKGPFSIRITNQASNTLVAENVIPAGWTTGAAYKAKSNVSF